MGVNGLVGGYCRCIVKYVRVLGVRFVELYCKVCACGLGMSMVLYTAKNQITLCVSVTHLFE